MKKQLIAITVVASTTLAPVGQVFGTTPEIITFADPVLKQVIDNVNWYTGDKIDANGDGEIEFYITRGLM